MPIKKATIKDAAALTVLVNTAYRGEESLKGWATEAHLLDGARIDEETLTEYLNNDAITILMYTNEARKPEACVYLEVQPGKLYLGMLSVLPHLQDKGIGRQLLLAAEDFAKINHRPVIGMTVISVRTELINWYERRGYVRTGEMLPFHVEKKFGVPKAPMVLVVLEKVITP